jgi:hypothetical protein
MGASIDGRVRGMGRTLVWATVVVVALLLVGSMVLSAIGWLLKIALYVALAIMIVGGAMMIVGKARNFLRGERRRELR